MTPALLRLFTCRLPRISGRFARQSKGLTRGVWARTLAVPLVLMGLLVLADGGGPVFAFGGIVLVLVIGWSGARILRRAALGVRRLAGL